MIEKSTFIYILNNQTPEESIFLGTDYLDIDIENSISVCMPDFEVPNDVNEKLLKYLFSE